LIFLNKEKNYIFLKIKEQLGLT